MSPGRPVAVDTCWVAWIRGQVVGLVTAGKGEGGGGAFSFQLTGIGWILGTAMLEFSSQTGILPSEGTSPPVSVFLQKSRRRIIFICVIYMPDVLDILLPAIQGWETWICQQRDGRTEVLSVWGNRERTTERRERGGL